jgi:hypothetical protein
LAELCVATNAVFVEDMVSLNIFSTNVVALQQIESSVCPAPRSSYGSLVAHAPEAVTRTQPEPFIVSTPFIRPVPPNWQVACGIYPRARRISPYSQAFSPGN